MLKAIDVTPTPEGLRHNVQLFEAQIETSEHLIEVTEEWLDFVDMEQCVYVVPSEFRIFKAALEAVQEQERQLIEHLREGIAVASPGTANPSESEQR